jgi:hypothetical protein
VMPNPADGSVWGRTAPIRSVPNSSARSCA